MRFGFGVLRLSPEAFWRMTPRELHCALCAVYGERPGAPTRDRLGALMRAFPDETRPT